MRQPCHKGRVKKKNSQRMIPKSLPSGLTRGWEPVFGTKIMRKQYVSNAQRLNLKGMRSNRNGEAD